MSFISKINPFRKDPERERISNLLPKIGKDTLIAEISQAILAQREDKIGFIQSKIPLLSLSKFRNALDLEKNVHEEAYFLPYPEKERSMTPTSWLPKPGFFGKTVQYLAATIWQSYGIDLDSPPKSTWSAQGQLNVFRSIISDSQWIIESALVFFVTVQKTVLAAICAFIFMVGMKKVYSYFQMGIPENLDKKQITNLSRKAEAYELKKAIGRTEETLRLITALTPSSIEKPKIAFLVGKPGVGKTQLVENLAIEMNEGLAPTLRGKKLFSVNTASLTEFGNFDEGGYCSRLDLIFKEIEGYETDVILFFDEAHNAAAKQSGTDSSSGNGSLIELLKTKLLEKNISAILATTQEEYDKYIAPNKAFVERTEQISIAPLSDEATKLILKESVQRNQISVSSDAIDTIIEIGNTSLKDRANPRKAFDILQKAERHVVAWQPSSLRKELEKGEIELRTLKANHTNTNNLLSQIIDKTRLVEQLKQKIKTQKASLDAIHAIGQMKKKYFRQYCNVVHQLNVAPIKEESLQRDYLFLKEILLPTLEEVFKISLETFEREYKETIPIQIDAPLLKTLIPTSR